MKKGFQASLFFLLIFLGFKTSLACTCVLDSLSKRFKKAEAVFIGKVSEDTPEDVTQIQNAKEGLQILEVIKAWKGVKKEYIAIDYGNLPKSVGNCAIFYYFEKDTEYLVFAYGKNLKIEPVCSDTRALQAEYNDITREIGRLDDFWFRFRARLNPF